MKTLFLARHAKSSWDHAGVRDFNRPLNDRGLRDAPIMAQRLIGHLSKHPLQKIITSDANRARSTASVYADCLHIPMQTDDELYLADTHSLLSFIHQLDDDVHAVMLVGHNPGMTDMINSLAHMQLDNLPTCGIAALQFPYAHWYKIVPGSGQLLFLDFPKKST